MEPAGEPLLSESVTVTVLGVTDLCIFLFCASNIFNYESVSCLETERSCARLHHIVMF